MSKKRCLITLFLCLAALFLTLGGASEARADSYGDWRYIVEDGGCVIINFYGSETNCVVPESFNDIPVVNIGTGSFYQKSIETIQIPPTVTIIDNNAFQDCHDLRAVLPYPGKSLNIRTIGWYAFYKTALSDLSGLLKNVTYMDDNVFYGCNNLTSVTLPSCLESMGNCVFKNCLNLKKINIPTNKKFTNLPPHTFYGCESLEAVTIPSNITRIGDKCFYRSGLKSLNIPASVTDVGIEAFMYCDNLDKLVFMNKDCNIRRDLVTGNHLVIVYSYPGGEVEKYLSNYNTAYCAMHDVTFAANGGSGTMKKVIVTEDRKFTLPKCGFTAPKNKLFDKWDQGAPGTKILVTKDMTLTAQWKDMAKQVTVSGGVYKLNLDKKTATLVKPAKKSLTKLNIPDTVSANGMKYKVTEIKGKAFKDMKKLATLTIGKNVAKIGASAFEGCEKLKTVTIKNDKLKKASFGSKCFKDIAAKATFKVPSKAVKNYTKWIVDQGKAPKTVTVKKK